MSPFAMDMPASTLVMSTKLLSPVISLMALSLGERLCTGRVRAFGDGLGDSGKYELSKGADIGPDSKATALDLVGVVGRLTVSTSERSSSSQMGKTSLPEPPCNLRGSMAMGIGADLAILGDWRFESVGTLMGEDGLVDGGEGKPWDCLDLASLPEGLLN